MPRQARLDAPDTLHHVMVRGIDRTVLFRDATDREDFLSRVAALAQAGAVTVYAWALLPNHAHLWPHHHQRRQLSPRQQSSPSMIRYPVFFHPERPA